ncbi:hypothetical protein DH2020_020300 [Rehmannia glutinosa]|uniref:C2H2-type domain-containing protein n=1 Tax=Rehmannia glutinosa TaxID=99300 RepID=A0ABR0WIL7_REHGL
MATLKLRVPHFRNSNQSQTQFTNNSAMWNNKQMSEDNHDDDSWEVRAFEEDTTGNLLGCTWPPRSYTCTFCRREFRSAQALGGHMNVHRRDRARINQIQPPHPSTAAKPPSNSTLLIPTPANGFCFLYALPSNPNTLNLPSSFFPIQPFETDKPIDTAANSVVSSLCHSTNTEPSGSNSNNDNNHVNDEAKDSAIIEELDLELRLGRKPPHPPP